VTKKVRRQKTKQLESEQGGEAMITLEFLKEQLEAKPFLPFAVVTSSGTRYQVKTPDNVHGDSDLCQMTD
jgi:hypothetical protein